MTQTDKLLALRANLDTVIAEIARIHDKVTREQRCAIMCYLHDVGAMLEQLREDLTGLIREIPREGTDNDYDIFVAAAAFENLRGDLAKLIRDRSGEGTGND